MTVAVIDYGAGNLASVLRALHVVGASPVVARAEHDLEGAGAIVVPGVGHFQATRSLAAVRARVTSAVDRRVPLLGICLGMHWLHEGSDESPGTPGLGVFPGHCVRLQGDVKIPHVGWNTLDRTRAHSRLLGDLSPAVCGYFAHSYAAPPAGDTVATSTHGATFAAAIERDRVFGTQFHPEKSGATGLRILAAFVAIARQAGTRC